MLWWGSKFGGSKPGNRKTPPRLGVWAMAGVGRTYAPARLLVSPTAPNWRTSRRVRDAADSASLIGDLLCAFGRRRGVLPLAPRVALGRRVCQGGLWDASGAG